MATMSLSALRRHKHSRLQSILQVLVLLTFAFGVIAHAGHQHELNSERTHVACACVVFGSMAGAPAHPPFSLDTQRLTLAVATPTTEVHDRSVETVAQPRAPPYSR
jgi:hypothetical protein